MIKRFLNLTLVTAFLAGAMVFTGCEKEKRIEENGTSTPTMNVQTCDEELNLDSIITLRSQHFSQDYGIDLQAFSEEEDLQEIMIEINEFSSDMFSFLENASANRVSAMITFLQSTMNQLSECEYNEDLACQMTMTELIYDSILPTKTRNAIIIGGITYQLPAVYLQTKANTIDGLLQHLGALYPSISNMEEEEYSLLLETAFIKSILDGNASFDFAPIMAMQDPPQGSYESCVKKAAMKMTGRISASSVVLTNRLIKCKNVPGYWFLACAAAVTAIYGYEVYDAKSDYSEAVALCGYQYPH